MFPFELEDDSELEEDEITIPTEYEIDFETGQLTGKIVEGLEAIKVWIWLALHTNRYYYEQYSWQYGNEMDTLIGKTYSKELIDSELKRMIKECLIVNEYITDIKDFECTIDADSITAKFTVISDYGEVETSV